MRITFLCFLLVGWLASILDVRAEQEAVVVPECPYTREEAVILSSAYFDTNNDDLVSRNELKRAWDRVLEPAEKLVVKYGPSAWVETVDTILDHCDYDRDGSVSLLDFIKSKETCLNGCSKLTIVSEKIFARWWVKVIDEASRPYYQRRIDMARQKLAVLKRELDISVI